MKLNDLIEALAGEIELTRPRLDQCLDQLATGDSEEDSFMDALDQYTSQAQRMAEAVELAGFLGLRVVCAHVLENSLLLAALPREERAQMVGFLRGWPPLIVNHLRNPSDPSTAVGLVAHLQLAPNPMDHEQALKVMYMLGAMPMQVALPGEGGAQAMRPVLASEEDVALGLQDDVDQKLLEGFFHEAPEQAHSLVSLVQKIAAGNRNSPDLVAAMRIAHTLKGSGSIIGLRGLTSLGHHFEDILDHFERTGSAVAKPAAETLLDAAYCLEQMVGYVIGSDEYPRHAQRVLQAVLDMANRADRGETLDSPRARVDATSVQEQTRTFETPTAEAPTAALRVSLSRVEELFRLSGEVEVHSAAMGVRVKSMLERSRELLTQNLRVQTRLFELETDIDARTLAMMRVRGPRNDDGFDSLEMDQYSELHSTAHALFEEAADARALAQRLEDEIAAAAALQIRQQALSKDLQYLVIGTRMIEVRTLESRLQRNVRSTCQATGKKSSLLMEGGDTLIDADMVNRLAEPLLHLLRNAVDHGIEPPAERLAAGKPESGQIVLNFVRRGQQVVLRCQDDGRGLDLQAIRRRAVSGGLLADAQMASDEELSRLILIPGFTTCNVVTEVSGRGVGLEVVRDWVSGLNGSVRIDSQPGLGCTFELRFPASLSTIHSLIVEVSGERFALPSAQIECVVPCGIGNFDQIGDQLVYHHDKRAYPASRLADLAGVPRDAAKLPSQYDVVILSLDDQAHALAVDRAIDVRDLLVTNPGRFARHVRGVAGLSILGDGGIAVNIDLSQLLMGASRNTETNLGSVVPVAAPEARPGVLIVDDALSVRNSLLQMVRDAGFRAEAARDGIDAIDAMREFKPDLVLTDLEMPRMNGIELTLHIRARSERNDLPVIMITSRSQDKHRRRAERAGVDAFLTKPYSDTDLLQRIRDVIAASAPERERLMP